MKTIINKFESINYQARYIVFSRALLAFGTFCTLAFDNPISYFRTFGDIMPINTSLSFTKISLFYILRDHLILAKLLAIVILLVVISGYFPRYSCLLHWWVSFSFMYSSFFFDGGDQITVILTTLLIPICILDNRINQWQKPIEYSVKNSIFFNFTKYTAVFSLFAIRLQIAILYLDSSLGKLKVKEWLEGTALYYWFVDPDFGMPNYLQPLILPLIKNIIILPFLTWGTILFEFLLFMCLVFPAKINKKFMYTGIFFHFMIFLIHGLFSFFIAMTASLILFLFPMEKLKFPQQPLI